MRDSDVITLAHGAGGSASSELIEQIFMPAFAGGNSPLQDSAELSLAEFTGRGDRLAFTTDSFVVSPIFFPGGDIGKLAVCGTVNDLAVSGAVPKYLSVGFILEEGLEIAQLRRVAESMASTATAAGVSIVTGDTKVVENGQVDKLYINTSGVGVIPTSTHVGSNLARAGDAILINGFIGDHGAAVMLARDPMGLHADITSDCAPLNGLIEKVMNVCPDIHMMRDATRGGVGSVLSEIADASGVSIAIDESELPVRDQTRAMCELLGMDPLFFANEGLAVFVLPQAQADAALDVMRAHPLGRQAAQIGKVTESSKGLLYINTVYGSRRMLERPYGIQLPRIC